MCEHTNDCFVQIPTTPDTAPIIKTLRAHRCEMGAV